MLGKEGEILDSEYIFKSLIFTPAMRYLTSLALLNGFLAGTASAVNFDKRCESKDVCLTSLIWCESQGGGCEFPEHVYPVDANNKASSTALIWQQEYELTWRIRNSDYTVNLRWNFGGGLNGDPEVDGYMWEKNFTNGETSYKFSFQDIADGIAGNTTGFYALKGMASDLGNRIQLSQPDLQEEKDEDDSSNNEWSALDYTDPFMVIDYQAERFLEAQRLRGRNGNYNKWKLGVGVGVGVGVPLLLAAAFVGGCLMGKGRKAGGGGKDKSLEMENQNEAPTAS
ncbi:hypothetical protein N3K66_007966 [Trichothecium roseum]|uniref:Uncharacterized protein n=1 Tax=Trichothecium roseum TaxID=47278 RepID=A0ACC0US34_9HYPO|nr:hypothetical protein N3K66_007966 [Trichothecium roseum]